MSGFFGDIGKSFGFGRNGSQPPDATPNTPSVSGPNQPSPDFEYSDINTIPVSLQPTFNNLKKAINAKKNILEQYKGLYATLQSMDGLLITYISNHASTTQELDDLKTEKERLENERNELNNRPSTNPEDQAQIATLNQQIADKQNEIDQLNKQQSLNVDNMTAINKLLDEATNYINSMYPTNNTEITNIQKLIDQMKGKLGSVPVVADAEFNFDSVYNPYREIGSSNRKGGYRYSSSQMRRKSTARRSSSSRSSSSQRRRNKNKNKQTKKMMLGGKRMKKAKSKFTKRKNHKKH